MTRSLIADVSAPFRFIAWLAGKLHSKPATSRATSAPTIVAPAASKTHATIVAALEADIRAIVQGHLFSNAKTALANVSASVAAAEPAPAPALAPVAAPAPSDPALTLTIPKA